ncbi:MAG: hypothetical protein COW76_20515 [Shewanella sp. CG18_big_fil_WC_8_21_14_2_50_42_11]|uniref:gp436 family protein n=1 Tax=Shewanella sp. CG18_big_fil_WC_8_21_14_2_50_42_11 TaxID=1975538 RepID=UPI000C4045C2|nr:phage protein Gp36 family protein [Shewanella sp. CG18_big_fil_WC_8_21_14_2_50_42_11]PIP98548.1 MAG: hypothetical protein COW76_20515 [Shewanella sp. CG18_big_fil_WC_8_21_14_2_50_42_11]
MTYCTVADMQTRFDEWELIGLSNPGGQAIDAAVIEQAIVDAEAEIESYLGGRYALPLNPVPKVLNRIACTLARYYLHDGQLNEAADKAYQDALRFLKDVAKGLVKLGVDTDGAEATSTSQTVKMQSDSAVWGRKNSGGFI